jgi:CDP-paratose 2-epimerase
MNVLVTGCAGFVGSTICHQLRRLRPDWKINGLDNLSRVGSETNIPGLIDAGVNVVRGDVRCETDFELFRGIDFVIDAAANPSVLAGTTGTGSRQLVDQNLVGTINTLEFCRRMSAGLILLSSSRVYSISDMRSIPLVDGVSRYVYGDLEGVSGVSPAGISEEFSTKPPMSLYGVTKLASELMAMEYAYSYNFPVFVNRCGVMSGEGQFGIASQGIVSYWIAKAIAGEQLCYTGQGGKGFQVRDLMHPNDLAELLVMQMESECIKPAIYNVSGGMESSFSLFELTEFCKSAGLDLNVASVHSNRPNDVPHVVLDSSLARDTFRWVPSVTKDEIFSRVLGFLLSKVNWLRVSGNA